MTRLGKALAGAAVVLGALAPAAPAATTIGQNFAPTTPTGARATVLQSTVSAGAGYRSPVNGIVTSWRFQAGTTTEETRLKIGRQAPSGSGFDMIAESDFVTPAPDQLNTFNVRIPIEAGDIIGLYQHRGDTPAAGRTSSDEDQLSYLFSEDHPVGTRKNYLNLTNMRINLTAVIEADGDGDGYGDETQDLCPADATIFSEGCNPNLLVEQTADRTTAGAYQRVTFSATATAFGPGTAHAVALSDTLPKNMALVTATTDTGSCSGKLTVVCQFGDMKPGQSAKVSITVETIDDGTYRNVMTVAGAEPDRDPRNNASVVQVAVSFAPGACANSRSGDEGNNSIFGSSMGDRITGAAGHDLLSGLLGADCLDGGPGVDRLFGGGGIDSLIGGDDADVLRGDAGDDRLSGDRGRDSLSGGSGRDRLSGGADGDRLTGGSGPDRLDGGAGGDRLSGGSGVDRYAAGSGNDTVSARDRRAETVDCGPGRDVARVDRSDRVRRCETVRR